MLKRIKIITKRIYDEPKSEDGFRILVDRLWPRGLSKEKAGIDLWLKEIAPSSELRKWFAHDPSRWEEFKKRYRSELKSREGEKKALIEEIKKHGKVSLLYAASDRDRNNAIILADVLDNMFE